MSCIDTSPDTVADSSCVYIILARLQRRANINHLNVFSLDVYENLLKLQ